MIYKLFVKIYTTWDTKEYCLRDGSWMCLEDGKRILNKDLKSYKVYKLIKGRTIKSF